jgi:flagellar basal body-associated protein FliL
MAGKIFKSRMAWVYAAIIAGFVVLAAYGGFILVGAGKTPPQNQQIAVVEKTYYKLPSIVVDMTGSGKSSRVQFDISLEVARTDMRILEGYQPRITERLNDYLSNAHFDAFNHRNSLVRMRQEMLQEVNNAGAPVTVYDLILRKIIVM